MYYINPTLREDGSYPPLQSSKAPGLLAFPAEFMSVFYPEEKRAAGFVTIEHDGQAVTACVWNEEAYRAWSESNPEPEPQPEEPTLEERVSGIENAIERGLSL